MAWEVLVTCILIGSDELTKPKALVLSECLTKAGKDAKGYHMPFEQYMKEVDTHEAIVINGLDNIDVRHDVQRSLWPDVVIDGAIGDFTCQVSRHPWAGNIACLICLFRRPDAGPAEEFQQPAYRPSS